MKTVEFPIVDFQGHEFFFVGRFVMVCDEDKFEEFQFLHPVNAIKLVQDDYEGLEVLLVNGDKFLITGGPTIVSMYCLLYQAA